MAVQLGIELSAVGAQGVVSSLENVERSVSSLGTKLKDVAPSLTAVMAGSISVGGYIAWQKAMVDSLDALNDLKDATGATIENISALEDVARRTGTSFETVGTALVKLNRSLSSATSGSTAEAAINAIGLSVKELKNLDPAEAFRQIALGLAGFSDDANKARVVQELFGKSIREVAPLLNELASSGALVATVTTEQAKSAEDLNKQLFGLQTNALNAGRGLVGYLLPSLNAVATEFTKSGTAAGNFSELIGGGLKVALQTVSVVVSDVSFVLKGVGREIGAVAAQMVALGSLDIKGFNAISQAVKEDGIRARQELDLFQRKLLSSAGNPADQTGAESARLARTKPSLNTIGDFAKANATKDASDAFSRLNTDIAKVDEAAQAYLDTNEKQTESDKFRMDTLDKINAAWVKKKITLVQALALENAMNDAQEKGIAVETRRNATKQAEDLAKEAAAAAKAYDQLVASEAKAADSLEDKARKQLEQNDAIGLSTEAAGALEAATLRLYAAELDRKANLQDLIYLDGQMGDETRSQAEATRALASAKEVGAQKKAAYESAKAAAESWKRAADQIESSITDALMRGFENGKGFAENLRDTIVNTFKTMVLRPMVSAIVSPLAGGALSMLGGNAAAAGLDAATGSASALQGAAMLGTAKAWLTDFGGSFAQTMNTAGQKLYELGFEKIGGGLMDATSQAGGFSTIAKYAQTAGDALGYLNTAILASEGKWGAALGSGIGTWFGGPIGAAIGGAIGGWVDNAFGGGHEYTLGTGISGTFSGAGFKGRNYQDWRNDGSSGFFGIGGASASSGTNYSALDSTFTKQLGAAFATIKVQTAGFANALGLSAAQVLGYSQDIKVQLGADQEANKTAITNMFKDIANSAANVVLDSQYMRSGEAAADTLARLATNLNAVNGGFDNLGKALLSASQASGDIASSLVDAFGGLQSYQSALGSYYQNFYSEEERIAKAREQTQAAFNKLGLSLPSTLTGYRDLVNAQDVATEAGRNTFTTLIGLSNAFATLNTAQKALTDSLTTSANKLRDAASSISLQNLDPAKNAAALQEKFDQTYSLAKSTTGLEKAGYADKLAAVLPELSKALKATTSTGLYELTIAKLLAQSNNIANQLQGLPSYAVGTDYVPSNRIAKIHEGEAIVPRGLNAMLRTGGGQPSTGNLEALIAKQAEQLDAMRQELRAIATHTARTADSTATMNRDGVLIYTDPAEPITTQVAA